MTAVVISQPMFLPWRGIFEQMKLSDVFVFYDDVQLPLGGGAGRGFLTRVQIKSRAGQQWLTMPVQRAGQGMQLIRDAQFVDLRWKKKHLSSIRACYEPAPFFNPIFEDLVLPIFDVDTLSLSEFCIQSMQRIAAYIGLNPRFRLSSHMPVSRGLDPSQRVLRICQAVGATRYITGHGASNYLRHDIFDEAGVHVEYIDYRLTPYPQRFGPFIPYVSVVDLLFNVGPAASEYLDSQTVDWRTWLGRHRQDVVDTTVGVGTGTMNRPPARM
jgi:hypothetical protein